MTYTVRKGDTLYDIAARHLGSGSKWRELGFTGDPTKLPVGTVLNFGGGQPAGAPAAASAGAPTSSGAPSFTPRDMTAEYTKIVSSLKPQYDVSGDTAKLE